MVQVHGEKEAQKHGKGTAYLRGLFDTLLKNMKPNWSQVTKELMKQADSVFDLIAKLDGDQKGTTISKQELVLAHQVHYLQSVPLSNNEYVC